MDYKKLSEELKTGEQSLQSVTSKLSAAMSEDDAFKDLAVQLQTSVQSVPNIVNVLSEAFANMEGGGSAEVYVRTPEGSYIGDRSETVTAQHDGTLYAFVGQAYIKAPTTCAINDTEVTGIINQATNATTGYSYFTNSVNAGDEIEIDFHGSGGGATTYLMLIVIA